MQLPTLQDFIQKQREGRSGFPSNAYIDHPGFEYLYVRMGRRYLAGESHQNVFDIANVKADKPGSGAFPRLVDELLAHGLTVYVECVMNPRFERKLERMGFVRVPGALQASTC